MLTPLSSLPRDCVAMAPKVQTLNLPLLKGDSPVRGNVCEADKRVPVSGGKGGTRRVTERFCELRIAHYLLSLLLVNTEQTRPQSTAAIIPTEAEDKGPLRAPKSPSFSTASFVPFARL